MTINTHPAGHKHQKAIDGFVKGPARSEHLHQRAEKAQTLMRQGLRRPASVVASRLAQRSANPKIETQLRAKSVPKHSRVEHFGQPMPSTAATQHIRQQKAAVSGEIVSRGYGQQVVASAIAPAEPLPSMVTSASHQKLERLLDEALTKADAHKQALRYQAARHFWHRRWFSGPLRWAFFGGLVIVLLAVLGLAWDRYPQLSMKVASIQTHFAASVPAYQPDGFGLAGPAKANSGSIIIKYKSATDPAKAYTISQTQSDLTSTLVAQNVVPKGLAVQTSQVDGNTVYIYGPGNDAAWVNNSVLYQIKDNAKLSSDQLINIVRGLNP